MTSGEKAAAVRSARRITRRVRLLIRCARQYQRGGSAERQLIEQIAIEANRAAHYAFRARPHLRDLTDESMSMSRRGANLKFCGSCGTRHDPDHAPAYCERRS